MTDDTFQVTQITLATTHTEAMVRFYATTFATAFTPLEVAGTTLYRGRMHGLTFILCPNTLAGVQAERSRHQLTYATPDLAATLARAVDGGGTIDAAANGHQPGTSVTVRDPDDNSILFLQAP
ncbi:MAG TPA: VOC family protein [Herpetosiphonaceae bacterium]